MGTQRGSRDDGAAAVEFALVLPFLLLLVFGLVDFGRAYNAKVTLTHAARESARMLAVDASVADVENALAGGAEGRDIAPGVDATIDPATSPCTPTADDTTVVLESDFSYLTPLPGLAVLFGGSGWDNTVTITAKAVMRCGG